MGWVVWIALSVLSALAGYVVAVAMYPDRGILDRLCASMIVSVSLLVVAMYSCGAVGQFRPLPLGIVSLALFSAVAAVGIRVAGWTQVLASARQDLGAPRRLLQDTWSEREIAMGTLVPAGFAFVTCCVMVWYFRSWTWDALWYHVPMTHLAIQEGTLAWVDTPVQWTEGNPRIVELLAAWNCIFARDNRFDDSPQLALVFLGAGVVAAWARQVGASRPIAAALGATWVALPPMFLQLHSSHNDIAYNAFFTAAVYFASRTPTRRDRWMCYTAFGLFVGSKYVGPFHLALLAPYLIARAGLEVWSAGGARWRRVVDVALSFALFLLLAIPKYVQNWTHRRNPMWPFTWQIRSLNLRFPGIGSLEQYYSHNDTDSPMFFGAPHAFTDLISSWFDDNPFFHPTVSRGGFGPVFRWLLLPCVLLVVIDLLRSRNWRRSLLVIVLFVQSLMVPFAFYPRFVMGSATASLVAFAIVYSESRRRLARIGLAGALVALTWVGYRDAYRGFIVYPRYVERARAASTDERAALQIDTFIIPTRWALARERELNHGDVFAYDESVHFLGDLFNHNYDSRVTFVSSAGDPSAYVQRLRRLRARWVGVTGGSPAERVVREAGGEFLFTAPDSSLNVHRMPAGWGR